MKKTAFYIFIGILIILSLIIIIGGGFGEKSDSVLLNNGKSIIFAHRGYVNFNVENSEEAFSKTDSIGFKSIETDINCTKDGKLIIFHDDYCKRLLGIDTGINELNWDDIKFKNLMYKGKQTTNKVLSLDMFLKQTDPSKILYLDIKKAKKSIADSLLKILEKHKEHKNIIIADDKLLFLIYLKSKNHKIRVALEGFNKGKEWIYIIIPKKFKPDYYSSFLDQADEKHMTFLKEHKLIKNKIVYGVNAENIQTVFDLGIKNIILDYDCSMGSLDSLELNLNNNN